MSNKLLSSFDEALYQYKTDLSNHDWYYGFSDDNKVYSRGRNNHTRLRKIAEDNSVEFKIAYNEEYAKHFNNESFFSKDRPYVPPFEV